MLVLKRKVGESIFIEYPNGRVLQLTLQKLNKEAVSIHARSCDNTNPYE